MKRRRWTSRWGFPFFGLPSEYKLQLHTQIFNLCYHGQGGFTWDEVYSLPIHLRVFYINQIIKTIEEQNKKNKEQTPTKSSKPPTFSRK